MNEINAAWDYWDEYAFWEDVECVIKQVDNNIRPVWNQGKNNETKTACTIVWAVNQLIRLFWLSLTTEQTNKLYIEAVHYCEKYWYIIGGWWWVPDAVNAVRKWWNEIAYKTFNKEKVFSKRLLWNNEQVIEALEKWHLVGFSKTVNFWTDQVEWLVRRDPKMYPKMVGHRLNFKWVKYTKATWWADISKAERAAQDNYHGAIWENFAFKSLKQYIYNWINWYCYLILPVSWLKTSIEEEKIRIAKTKAINATIGVLTTTWWDMDEAYQELSSSYASALRDQYPEARAKEENEVKKVTQSVTDILSYAWKFVDEEDQKMFADLASHLRAKHNLK